MGGGGGGDDGDDGGEKEDNADNRLVMIMIMKEIKMIMKNPEYQ